MPPKKAAAPKKDAKADAKKDGKNSGVDTSGMPINECNFKLSMEIKQEQGHYHRIKYDWWDAKVDGEISTIEIDTGFFKDWNLLQVEGDEPISQLTMQDEDEKKGPSKGRQSKDAMSKKATGKGAPKAAQHEEITDPRPRTIDYMADFAENGIPAMKVSELVAEKFQT
jgi:hypothetical protein